VSSSSRSPSSTRLVSIDFLCIFTPASCYCSCCLQNTRKHHAFIFSSILLDVLKFSVTCSCLDIVCIR
jgi:hypothetical protein